MRIAVDTSVVISHLRGDEFSQSTFNFLKWTRKARHHLVMSEVAYAELYAGIHLADDPAQEERRVQRLLSVNRIDTRLTGSLKVPRRAGELYAKYLEKRGGEVRRILPDFLIGAHAELYSDRLITWNPQDFKNILRIQVSTPNDFPS